MRTRSCAINGGQYEYAQIAGFGQQERIRTAKIPCRENSGEQVEQKVCGPFPSRRGFLALTTHCKFWHTFMHDTSTSTCCSAGGCGRLGQRTTQPPVYQGNLFRHFPKRGASSRVLHASQVGGF